MVMMSKWIALVFLSIFKRLTITTTTDGILVATKHKSKAEAKIKMCQKKINNSPLPKTQVLELF
jgi:hypothetical protein